MRPPTLPTKNPKKTFRRHQMNRLTSLVVQVEGGQLRQDRAVQQVCPTRCWRGWCWSWCWTVAPSAPLEHCFHGNHASPNFTGNHDARSFPDCVLQQVLNFAGNMLLYLRIFTVRQSFWLNIGGAAATCQAQLPACHRTAEVLRGDQATSDGVSHPLSPPSVIHTVNLIINQPLSPPSSRSQQRLIHSHLLHVFAKSWCCLKSSKVLRIHYNHL